MTTTTQTIKAQTEEMRATLASLDLKTARHRYSRRFGAAAFDAQYAALTKDPAANADGFIAWLDQLRMVAETLRDKALNT